MKSTRWAFVIVSIITIILLVGSAVLQRMVFRAAESEASVFLSPSTFIVKPQGEVSIDIISSFPREAFVASAQFVLDYDPDFIQFNNAVAGNGFTTKKIVTGQKQLSWLLLPAKTQGIVGQYNGSVTIGRLNFIAAKTGSTTINVNPRLTKISAVDPEGQFALYNAARSFQNSAGEITELSVNNKVTPASSLANQANGTIFSTQRIISNSALPLSESALIALELRYAGKVEVNFGPTENLGNTLVSLSADTAHLLKLQGLSSNTEYYYQLKILDQAGKTVIVTPVRSFATVSSSNEAVSPNLSELVPLVSAPADSTDILVVTRDEKGQVIEPSNVSLRIIAGEATVLPVEQSRPYRATVKTTAGARQEVVIAGFVGETEIGQVEITFDPTRAEQISAEDKSAKTLKFDRSVQLTLATLLAVLLLSGLVLVRLLKVH